jgi:hypothetical protein
MMQNCMACNASNPHQQLAWLIEGDGNYWDGRFADSRGFTRKVDDAVRFVRQQDADAVKHWLLQANAFALRTTQHAWCDSVHK